MSSSSRRKKKANRHNYPFKTVTRKLEPGCVIFIDIPPEIDPQQQYSILKAYNQALLDQLGFRVPVFPTYGGLQTIRFFDDKLMNDLGWYRKHESRTKKIRELRKAPSASPLGPGL